MDYIHTPFSLEGKTILITGASSGIGRQTSIECSKLGASLVITGRNVNRLKETLSSLYGENHKCIVADLTDFDSRFRLVEQLPQLDGIVHCAGIGFRKASRDIEPMDVQKVMDTNFSAPVLLQAEILRMKRINKGASIVFISSRAYESPSIGNSLYSASKGAINSYSKCLSLELAPRKIRVNCICPAMVWTDLILQSNVTKEDLEEAQLRYPLKRYGRPEDVAYLVLYLLCDASSWMTGSFLDLSGGGEGTLV